MINLEKNLEEHTRRMLKSTFCRGDLNTLAGALGIKTGEMGENRLIDKLSGISLTKAQYAALYDKLSPPFLLFLHYLNANQRAVKLGEARRFLEGWDAIQKQGYFAPRGANHRWVFSRFKRELAAKGLALFIENPSKHGSVSKFERFSLYLPGHYSDFLPALPVKGAKMTEAGEKKSFDEFAKDILFSSLKLKETENKTMEKIISQIFWRGKNFLYWNYYWIINADGLLTNIFSAWKKERTFKDVDVATNLFYLLKCLPPDEWIKLPDLIESLGSLTCFPEPDKIKKTVSNLCGDAFDAGLLERIERGSESYYRLNRRSFPFVDPSDDASAPSGIHVEEDGSLIIDWNETPVHLLLEVLLISDWSHADHNFICRPSLLHLGKFFRELSHFSNLRLYNYFMENSQLYRNALQKVEDEFGRFMIHTNLSIFEIRDVAISALLNHRFPGRIYSLGDDFFVAAEKDEPEILKFLERNKYSVNIKGESLKNAFA